MFSFFDVFGAKEGLAREFVPFAVALLVAQLFFKWGNFSLELTGFVGTWWLAGFVFTRSKNLSGRN